MKVINPRAPEPPYATTWIVVKEAVDFADLSAFTLSLGGAVMCAQPAKAPEGAPGGHASVSFTTTDSPSARPGHTRFARAACEWLEARGASYAWQYPGGRWQHSGPGA